MIQRAQTLFLLGAIILQVALFFVPFWNGNDSMDFNGQPKTEIASLTIQKLTENFKGQIDSVGDAKMLYIFQGFNALIIVFSAYCIFLFRKRMLQLRASRLLILLASILLVGLFYYSEEAKRLFADDASNLQKIGTNFQLISNTYGMGIYLPICSLALFFTTGIFIQKDEKLVRSADRLR